MSKNIHATQDWVRDNISIKPKVSGEIISLSDSAEAPIPSMRIFGKTKQATTTGKNKFDANAVYGEYKQADGSFSTISVVANGIRNYFGEDMIGKAVTITAMLKKLDSNQNYIALRIGKSDGSFVKGKEITNNNVFEKTSLTFTVSSKDDYWQITYGNSATSVIEFKDVLVSEDTDATWEPYTGGIPSPNPDYPQELVSVGDGGSTTEYVMGGNLFNNDTSLLKEVTYNSFDGSNRRIGYEPLQLPAGTYTFTLTDLDTSLVKYVYGSINDKDGKFVRACHLLQSTNNYTPLTITVNEGDKIFIYSGHTNLNMADRVAEFKKVQIHLNAGSVAKPYEPYKSQSLTIPTPNGLPGLKLPNNVSSLNYDYSYVIDGTRFVCDEKDYKRFIYRNPIRTIVYTGDENWRTTVTTITNIYYLPLPAVSAYGISSHFQSITHSQYQNGEEGMHISNTATLYINASQFATLEEFKAFLKAQYEAGTPVTLVYAVKNAKDIIETPLSEEEIQAYKALHTNYPNTIIYNSDGAGAEVEYVADTKNYIDNKFAELQANILSVAK